MAQDRMDALTRQNTEAELDLYRRVVLARGDVPEPIDVQYTPGSEMEALYGLERVSRACGQRQVDAMVARMEGEA